eukprot:m.353992 g.353992  ORF g.353992 m.353992 type:complete len:364 (+) comp16891_c0_seq1:321-1412(+)
MNLQLTTFAVLLACTTLVVCAYPPAADLPSVPLVNSARKGMTYSATGLGTGGYGTNKNLVYPECWAVTFGCGDHSKQAVIDWLHAGGRRIDSADSYFNMPAIGEGIVASGVPRSEIFLTSKIGSTNAMGYNDTMSQIELIKQQTNVSYVDLLLIHWPTSTAPSSDPVCQNGQSTYNATECRLTTWRAMIEIYQRGDARAIGVSNYEVTHLQEIIDAGLPLPAVNQVPFNPYRSLSQQAVLQFCVKNSIVLNGYSPLGIPDLAVNVSATDSLLLHRYPPPMSPTILEDPLIVKMAQKYKVSPAQFIQNWAWSFGVPTNARTYNKAHMVENLNAFSFTIDKDDVTSVLQLPENYCKDDQWYECAP